jgi:hypothetical protein
MGRRACLNLNQIKEETMDGAVRERQITAKMEELSIAVDNIEAAVKDMLGRTTLVQRMAMPTVAGKANPIGTAEAIAPLSNHLATIIDKIQTATSDLRGGIERLEI